MLMVKGNIYRNVSENNAEEYRLKGYTEVTAMNEKGAESRGRNEGNDGGNGARTGGSGRNGAKTGGGRKADKD